MIAQIASLREQWGGRGVGGGGVRLAKSFSNPEKGRGAGLCGFADVSPGDVNSRARGAREEIPPVKN